MTVTFFGLKSCVNSKINPTSCLFVDILRRNITRGYFDCDIYRSVCSYSPLLSTTNGAEVVDGFIDQLDRALGILHESLQAMNGRLGIYQMYFILSLSFICITEQSDEPMILCILYVRYRFPFDDIHISGIYEHSQKLPHYSKDLHLRSRRLLSVCHYARGCHPSVAKTWPFAWHAALTPELWLPY